MAAIARSRRGFTAAGGQPSQERVRTHLFFSSQAEHQQQKRKRRPTNKLHQLHRKDEMVQTGPVELDPSSWTGNQRVLHFGPMAQRNPFFYYYPKGWDILYPAHFGFFPYRTSKFRGSSPIICLSAFGAFFLLGGGLMTYLGYYVLHDSAFWNWPSDQQKFLPPIQLAGPTFLAIGGLFVILGFCWWMSTLHLLRESLRHSQYHHGPPKRTVRTYQQRETTPRRQPPYQPLPPPAYPILANAYTEPTVFSPQAELKLYPPVMQGFSTLSLHGRSASSYMGSPYNTLQAPTTTRYHPSIDQSSVVENTGVERERHGSSRSRRKSDPARSRAKSAGASSSRTSRRDQHYQRDQHSEA